LRHEQGIKREIPAQDANESVASARLRNGKKACGGGGGDFFSTRDR
jgi:hypothetical protein